MTKPALQPETIQKLGSAAYPAFAMIAGMQLDLFTPLAAGPKEPGQLALELGADPARLAPLLYALVAAGLLTEEGGRLPTRPKPIVTWSKASRSTLAAGTHSIPPATRRSSRPPNPSAPAIPRQNSISRKCLLRQWRRTCGACIREPGQSGAFCWTAWISRPVAISSMLAGDRAALQ